ncbi:MAG: RICIN domain-containing protein [Ruminococcus sp.]
MLKSACTDCYLDVSGASTANYANIQMYTFNGTLAQQFTITKV